MSNSNYDTYCGLYCGACSILMFQKNGFKDKFPHWDVEPYQDVATSQVQCQGCKGDRVFANCEKCQIRTCARDRKIEHCALDCTDFPCTIWSKGNDQSKDFVAKLPHLKAIQINLQTIAKVGVSQWLVEQNKQWKCPECQTNFSWYTSNCTNCGKNLENIKTIIDNKR